ncbi:HEAT repeat domain-containing protein [uncultured Winogradskyella sp.]|uniref:HEAT repeat domain-containing protein n=1 Tax=uncultured Winogradskyella sp. TaxID=395353 RepID=UPI00262CB58C|nr:HEAT repeat domain-containing protein [uncultured Winogradskyella sp.]
MLHQFTYMFFKLKLIQPSEDTIMHWCSTYAVTKLEYALKHGNYKTRLLTAKALEQVGQASSIPILLVAMHNKIQNVSITALNALESLGCSNELMISITRKRFNWVKKIRTKEEKQKNKSPKTFK